MQLISDKNESCSLPPRYTFLQKFQRGSPCGSRTACFGWFQDSALEPPKSEENVRHAIVCLFRYQQQLFFTEAPY